MSNSRRVPDDSESSLSIFPSEGDDATPRASGPSTDTGNSFLVFSPQDQITFGIPKELKAVSGFQSEQVSGLLSEVEPAWGDDGDETPAEGVGSVGFLRGIAWRPAIVSVARTCARSFSASHVFWWPILIAVAGMFAVEMASRRDISPAAKFPGASQTVANLQAPRVRAPLAARPADRAAATATMVLSATDTKVKGAATDLRTAEILAPPRSVPASTLDLGPVAQPVDSLIDRAAALAPDVERSVAAATPPSVEVHSAESPAVAAVADVIPVPSERLAIAPAIVDAEASDRAAIDRVLGTYRQSYSSLDAAMVSTVWRGLDTRGLQRAFDGLDSQRMSFEHCDVHVGADTAKAACTGVLDYVRKIGQANPLQKRLSWNFDLQRTGDRWLISGVEAR